jgi:hypothetical protein
MSSGRPSSRRSLRTAARRNTPPAELFGQDLWVSMSKPVTSGAELVRQVLRRVRALRPTRMDCGG